MLLLRRHRYTGTAKQVTTLTLIPVTVPELLRQLRDTVIPAPCGDGH